MSYTNRKFPNDTTKFLPPPTWLVWTEGVHGELRKDVDGNPIKSTHPTRGYRYEYEYDYTDTGEGTIRHVLSLQKAKAQLGSMKHNPKFHCNWAIYEWVDNEWVLRFEGRRDQDRKSNLLYQIKIDKTNVDRPHLDLAVEEAIASIARVAG